MSCANQTEIETISTFQQQSLLMRSNMIRFAFGATQETFKGATVLGFFSLPCMVDTKTDCS